MQKTEKLHCTFNKDETIKQLQKKICTIRQKYSRANRRNERLHENVIEIRNKMKEISDSSLKNIIDAANIPVSQSDVIYEIFNAAKMKNSKNRKYSENWIIQCFLFQMRYYYIYIYFLLIIILCFIIFVIDHLVDINL